MDESFFEWPTLKSPYVHPARHWELDEDGQPTSRIIESRRRSELITPVPKPQRRRRAPGQGELVLGSGDGLSTEAEIDEEAWESLSSDTSGPLPKPKCGSIAAKVINHLDDEVMKVFR